MSRSSIPTARAVYDSMSYDQLRVAAADVAPVGDRTPKQWFELALQHAEAARQADRRGSKAAVFVEYTQLATAYKNALFHPGTKEAKAADPRWATRVAEFKPVRVASNSVGTQLTHHKRHGRRPCRRRRRSRKSSSGLCPNLPREYTDWKSSCSGADALQASPCAEPHVRSRQVSVGLGGGAASTEFGFWQSHKLFLPRGLEASLSPFASADALS